MSNPLLASEDVRCWREMDASGLNAILNDPSVRPWIADLSEGEVDLSPAVDNHDNVLLMGEHGAVFFICILPGTYECHTQILPRGRGNWSGKFAIAVLDWMFVHTNAWEIVTRIPAGHIGALALTRSVGFQYEFTSMEPCHFRGKTVHASTWRLSIHDWVGRSALYAALGEKLHGQMAEEALRLLITTPPHAPDLYHDQIAGAAMEMVRNGLMLKALTAYNRWAVLARHRPISMIGSDPPVIAMDLGAMRIKESGIEIVP